jgi:hypothetical protein
MGGTGTGEEEIFIATAILTIENGDNQMTNPQIPMGISA